MGLLDQVLLGWLLVQGSFQGLIEPVQGRHLLGTYGQTVLRAHLHFTQLCDCCCFAAPAA